MHIENLSTLKIYKLTQEQYNREVAKGNIDETALYLTPEEEYYTEDEIDVKIDEIELQIGGKADADHNHDNKYYTKNETDNKINGKANTEHSHDDQYYTESEINAKIDEINTSISNVIDGTIKVAKSINSDKTVLADKSTSDSSGNVITDTYETKTDSTSKLQEAKTYTDNSVAQKTQVQIKTWEVDD